jgi:hypothetical protein
MQSLFRSNATARFKKSGKKTVKSLKAFTLVKEENNLKENIVTSFQQYAKSTQFY